MKIAICYNGFLRSITETFESHKKFFSLDEHDVDFFVHTWTGDEYQKKQIEYVKNVVKPKSILIEESKDFQKNPYYQIVFSTFNDLRDYSKLRKISGSGWYTCRPYQLLSFHYSRFMSSQLLQQYCHTNDVEYDMVVCMRSDLLFDSVLDISSLDLNLINATRWDLDTNPTHSIIENFFSEMISISSQKNIILSVEEFLHIPYYYFNDKCCFVGEVLFDHHLKSVNLKKNYMVDIIHKVVRRPDVDILHKTLQYSDI